MAATRDDALVAFNDFVDSDSAKYPKVAEKLIEARDELLTFYDFPAKYWQHLRTTNPIELTFATVRHRTKRTRNCVSRATLRVACDVSRPAVQADRVGRTVMAKESGHRRSLQRCSVGSRV